MNKHVGRLQREVSEAREHRTGNDSDDSSSEDEEQRPRPSEEEIERMEEKLEAAQADQKNLFLIIFQHNTQVERYSQTLSTLLFTQDLDPHILDAFNQFVALRS
ncbi:hypothetical protein OTU49_002403 [Cherax quadricarinatus]|uniref:MIF4G-like type 2 domain-containing protein n=1 Tax=Cherax quadricarinatus TaxID=27406 RepID=A0AAW0YMZ1_CHEQU